MADIHISIDQGDQVHITTPAPPPTWHWTVGPVRPKEQTMPITLTMSTEEKIRLHVHPGTPGGAPGALDGPVTYVVTSGTCTLEPIDESSVWCLAGASGDSVISASGDADLGAGVVTITDTALVQVADPMATSLGLAADAPVLKASA